METQTYGGAAGSIPVQKAAAEPQTYNYHVVRQFAVMTVVWGLVGMFVGVYAAAELFWPALNLSEIGPWFAFGRIRPLHTSAVIFAFGGCGLIGTSYYVVQRTCNARLFGGWLPAFTFWGWQAVIVLAAVTLPLGYTQGKEYAELEWPIDILITAVWVAYAVVFFGTIAKRKMKHIYVANWFYGGFILAVALLHIVNNISIPAGAFKSYSVYYGAIDAMVQWWYGHNAVGFFLTAGFLGMMYYFVPKQANRPVYSYRLSVVHFWALIFTYMWAGPHHLHYTSLPDWTQTLGMVLSCGHCLPHACPMQKRGRNARQNASCGEQLRRNHVQPAPCRMVDGSCRATSAASGCRRSRSVAGRNLFSGCPSRYRSTSRHHPCRLV